MGQGWKRGDQVGGFGIEEALLAHGKREGRLGMVYLLRCTTAAQKYGLWKLIAIKI